MAQTTVFKELAALVTEDRNPDTYNVDIMSTEEILRLINREDKKVQKPL